MIRTGLLMAMMEPPAAIEEEFQDWYDTEHFPHLAGISGFETADRYVCVAGWPRYLSLYDLSSMDVLQQPAYLREPGKPYTPWTHRLLGKMSGQYRFAGEQIYPGSAKMGDTGSVARVLLLRFRGLPEKVEPDLLKGLKASFDPRADVAQIRLFKGADKLETHYIATVECRSALMDATIDPKAFGVAGQYLDLVNTYVKYWRRGYVPNLFES